MKKTVTKEICVCGVRNLNNRIYSKEVWDKAIRDKGMRRKILQKILFCYVRPNSDSIGDVIGIVKKLYRRKDRILCDIKFLPLYSDFWQFPVVPEGEGKLVKTKKGWKITNYIFRSVSVTDKPA